MKHAWFSITIFLLCGSAYSQPVNDECLRNGLKRFVAPQGGSPIEGDFVLLQWAVPPILPVGSDVPIKVSFFRTKPDTGFLLSAAMVGDWGKSAIWSVTSARKPAIGDTITGSITITTPPAPGQYRLRLMLRQLPRKQRDLPFSFGQLCERCVWSEAIINVVNLDGNQIVSQQPDRATEGKLQPAVTTSTEEAEAQRTAKKVQLDSMKAKGEIDESTYRNKLRLLRY
jgi:hypothetical protein